MMVCSSNSGGVEKGRLLGLTGQAVYPAWLVLGQQMNGV